MNARTTDKRNSKEKGRCDLTPGRRVGARHRRSDQSEQGGGYLDNCISSEILNAEKSSAEIIYSELKEIGLRDDLLMIAEKIGADNFLQMWHALDCHYEASDVGRFRVAFPSFTKYKKHLRNKFIVDKFKLGLSTDDIHIALESSGFYISKRSLSRIRQEYVKNKP